MTSYILLVFLVNPEIVAGIVSIITPDLPSRPPHPVMVLEVL